MMFPDSSPEVRFRTIEFLIGVGSLTACECGNDIDDCFRVHGICLECFERQLWPDMDGFGKATE